MPNIYIMAIITTALSLGILGSIIFARADRKDRLLLAVAIIAQLPMCALAFYLVRMPVDGLLRNWLGGSSGTYGFLTTFYAPLTEEPAKLLPLLIPWFLRGIEEKNRVRVAMALGLGFGIGEMWVVAHWISASPEFSGLPWYMFTGYLGERFMVCIMHGAFTAMALHRLHRGFVIGVLGAMFLHYIGNFPIYLGGINLWGLGEANWTTIVSLWIMLYFFAMMALLAYLAYGKPQAGRLIFGRAKCPECGEVYPRPLFAINMVTRRYEPCPACKRWHWTKEWKEEGGGG